ncbi:helix-turn-helix domain-containing protein [Desulfatiglans anilini]|nr:helix-turn-helix transcriptional regulator [Desulfatiglans anilini]
MGRASRIEYPGACYYICSKREERQSIFEEDGDFETFLLILKDVVLLYRWKCYAWSLMDDQYQIVAETPKGNLSRGMRQLNGVYTQQFNRRHGRKGPLFHHRYQSILIEKKRYLLELCRYVVLSPVRRGFVKRPEEYPWSSFIVEGRDGPAPKICDMDWVLLHFGGDDREAMRRYALYVQNGIGTRFPSEDLKDRCILGCEHFVSAVRRMLRSGVGLQRAVKFNGSGRRPSLEALFAPHGPVDKERRNKAIARARWEFGYSLKEIAKHACVHPSTISRIARGRSAEELEAPFTFPHS